MSEEGCQGTLDEASVLFICGIFELKLRKRKEA